MPDSTAFVSDTEPFRRELFAHCYRMLGSVADAEDLVQETYLRAWRAYDGFERRSSVRTWLYQIATNRCLTALAGHSRRMLPSGLYPPEDDLDRTPEPADPQVSWLQPVPDAMVASADPAAIVAAREGLRLALIASLQYLPPRQRAALILADVLDFPTADIAAMLGTTHASVKSALQRARARLKELAPAAGEITEPAAPQARALLDRYIAAFQNADAAALERLLVRDATLEATPLRTWFRGNRTCVLGLRNHVMGPPGTWRMLPTSANGQPATACYLRDQHGIYRPYGVAVLTMTEAGISGIVSFGDPDLVARFGFPPSPPRSLFRTVPRDYPHPGVGAGFSYRLPRDNRSSAPRSAMPAASAGAPKPNTRTAQVGKDVTIVSIKLIWPEAHSIGTIAERIARLLDLHC